MAVKLRLPDSQGFPQVVMFHREHPSDPMLVLQVPNLDATDSETYRIRLDRDADRAWMNRLQGSKRLLDLLQMEMHVAYEAATGACIGLPDADRRNPMTEMVQDARRMAGSQAAHQASRERRVRKVPAMSRHRMNLRGIVPGAGGEMRR